MGVKDLNVIIKSFTSSAVSDFSTVVIDGSNLLIIVLNRVLKHLRERYLLKFWNSIDLNIIKQYKFLVQNTLKEIKYTIRRVKSQYKASKIIIVMDPPNRVTYKMNDKMVFNQKYKEFMFDTNSEINVQMKENEQNRRNMAASKINKINRDEESIKSLVANSSDLKAEDEISLLEIYRQSNHFLTPSNLLKLMPVILSELDFSEDSTVEIVSAIDEADLVIKNIAEETLAKEPLSRLLVLSKDTDYCILFADNKNVYVSAFDNVTYNPHFIWSTFLKEAYNFDIIVRLAPLLGNDYSGEGLILANTSSSMILNLLNIDNTFHMIASEKRKKIKIFGGMNIEQDKITTSEQLDDAVYNFDRQYFRLYMSSVIIYTNWQNFGRRTEFVKSKINWTRVIPEKDLYNWNNEMFQDWSKFSSSVKVIENPQDEFDDDENFTEEYDGCDFVKEVYE
jgi:hypothetical protein